MIDYKEQYKRKDAEVFNAVRILQSEGGADTNRLFELTEKYIYKLINDIVKDPFTSGEVMEETYHRIYDELPSLSDPERFYTWAGRIATRFALKSVQKNRYLILDEESEDSGFDADMAEADTEEFIPDSVLSDAEKQRILADKIDNLTTEQRICVQFFYYEDMSVSEIADAFGCSKKAIRNTLGSARKEIKDVVTSMNVPATGKMYSLASVPVFYYLFRIGLNDIMAASAAGASAAGGIGGSAVSGSASDGAASASSVSGGAVSGTGNSSSPVRRSPIKKLFGSGKITAFGSVGMGIASIFLLIIIGIGVANIIHPSEDRDNNIPETAVSELDNSLVDEMTPNAETNPMVDEGYIDTVTPESYDNEIKEVAFERQENAIFYYLLFDGETNYYSHVTAPPLWGLGKYVVDGIMYDDFGVFFDPKKAADDAYNDALEKISAMQSEGHVLTGYGWDEFTGYVFYDDDNLYGVDSVFRHNS